MSEPASIFIFKTIADAFAGRINYFKVMSGALKNDATLTNFNRNTPERLQHVQVMQGKTGTELAILNAGDIGAIARRVRATMGENVSDARHAINRAIHRGTHGIGTLPRQNAGNDRGNRRRAGKTRYGRW